MNAILCWARKMAGGSRRARRLMAGCGMLLMAGVLLGTGGCSGLLARGGQNGRGDLVVRPVYGDTAQLLRNAHYFKLRGRQDLALKELEEAHRKEPQNLRVADALAQSYEDLGEGEKARKIYKEALAREPGHGGLQSNLCFSYYLSGDLKEAEACFRKALERQPQNVAARNNLGLVLCRQGRQEEALRLWRETEGDATAAGKLSQVLTALGLEGTGSQAAMPAAPKSTPETAAVASAPVSPVASPRPPAAPSQATAGPERAPLPTAEGVAAPPPSPRPAVAPKDLPRPKVAAATPPPAPQERQAPRGPGPTPMEVAETAIEVLNGNGFPQLARMERARLTDAGFEVTAIGNYRDFGMEQTTIYYRPEAQKVAWALREKMFPGARMEVQPSLAADKDIKVVLGHELLSRPDLLAQLDD